MIGLSAFIRFLLTGKFWLLFSFANFAKASIEIANFKQDLELLSREVAGLRSEVENMRRENAKLQMSLDQISRKTRQGNDDSQNLVSLMDGRLGDLRKRIISNELVQKSFQDDVDGKIQQLVLQMNESFDRISTTSSATPKVQDTFSTDYPQKGFVHKVEKGETVSSIAKKYKSKISLIINANQISDPTKVFVGRELFVPQ